MNSKANNFNPVRFLAVFVAIFALLLATATPLRIGAADLTNRSIMLGSSYASANTTHAYQFSTVTASDVGSIQFQYCSNSPLFSEPCTAPTGLNVMSAGIQSQTGITGFNVSGMSSASNLVITRSPQPQTPTTARYVFSNVINPAGPNDVTYVRITVYDGINTSGNIIDTGAVVFVTEERFSVELYVPPYLTFCVGVSVALNCSTTSGFLSNFGEFNPNAPTSVTSQFAAATNDLTGYNVFINGQTMTSGTNIIPALITQTASSPGQSQFGINLRANTSPSVGSNPQAGPVANAAPATSYNTQNQFRFVNGDRIAGSTRSTGFNRFTVSYLVNVSPNQPPGRYATTLNYTAVASF